MNTFKEGDRVSHQNHGEGAIVNPYDGTGWPTVQFDSGVKMMTAEFLLTPVPKAEPKFKIGDRVSHAIHRDGIVEEYSEHSGLYTVDIGGNRAYYALEHQISLTVPEPKFTVLYKFTHGNTAKSSGIPMNRQQVETYLTNFSSWDNVESITINRAKG